MRHLIVWALATVTFATAAHADDVQMIKRLKAENPKVQDAIMMTTGWLYVGVYDDGTRRDGYAEYFCLDTPSHVSHVKIVNYQKVLRNEGFHELGSATCPRN